MYFQNNPLINAGLAAIWKGGRRARTLVAGRSTTEDGRPLYVHHGTKGGRILVYPNPIKSANDPLPTAEALWGFVESLGPFTADVALAVLAQLAEPSTGDKPKHPLLEPVKITADAILAYKGIRRWGMERRLLRRRIHEEMERLRSLQFDAESWPNTPDPRTGKPPRAGASWRGDRLFDIVRVERSYQPDLFGGKHSIEVAWSVRAGQWAYWWFNAQGRVWLAQMSRVLLELDHRENRGAAVLAKKIGQHLTCVASNRRTFEMRIDRLLERVGELPLPEERDKNQAPRTRERFENAMLTLQEAGVLSTVEWPDGYGPGDQDRSKGWVERWLSARVCGILPGAPPKLPEAATRALPPRGKRGGGRKPKPPAPVQIIDGQAIWRARIRLGWTQEELARHLHIGRANLSTLEAGKRLPSRKLAKRIQAWLQDTAEGALQE